MLLDFTSSYAIPLSAALVSRSAEPEDYIKKPEVNLAICIQRADQIPTKGASDGNLAARWIGPISGKRSESDYSTSRIRERQRIRAHGIANPRTVPSVNARRHDERMGPLESTAKSTNHPFIAPRIRSRIPPVPSSAHRSSEKSFRNSSGFSSMYR